MRIEVGTCAGALEGALAAEIAAAIPELAPREGFPQIAVWTEGDDVFVDIRDALVDEGADVDVLREKIAAVLAAHDPAAIQAADAAAAAALDATRTNEQLIRDRLEKQLELLRTGAENIGTASGQMFADRTNPERAYLRALGRAMVAQIRLELRQLGSIE